MLYYLLFQTQTVIIQKLTIRIILSHPHTADNENDNSIVKDVTTVKCRKYSN